MTTADLDQAEAAIALMRDAGHATVPVRLELLEQMIAALRAAATRGK
jgi:hypothetical protein